MDCDLQRESDRKVRTEWGEAMKKKKGGCLRLLLKFVITLFAVAFIIVGYPVLMDLKKSWGIGAKRGAEVFQEIPYQQVTVPEEKLAVHYYYGLLGEEERRIYQELYQGLEERADEIYVHCGDANQANRILGEVLRDYPDFFWCDGGVSSTSFEIGDGGESYTVVSPEYNCTPEDKQARQDQIDAEANAALQGISQGASDYEKILYVYEYIVNSVEYDLEAPDNQNIYSSLVGKRSVCAGYSKAAQYLLERLGVSAVYVTGTANGPNSHAWNLVQCGGEYYHVDTTWGDPVYQIAEGEEAPQWETISYDYMCCGDAEIYRTHQPDAEYPLPECTGMAWNYYVVNGMYYEGYDSESALNALNSAIYEQRNPTIFKYFDEASYQQAKEDILNHQIHNAAQNLCNMYGLSEVQYYYEDKPELCKLTIYWQY